MREELLSLRPVPAKYEGLRTEAGELRADLREYHVRQNEIDLDNTALHKQLRIKQNEVQRQTRLVSHLKEELQQLRDEAEYLVHENQSYLDRIIR